jgi:hypothetical protein
VYCMAVTPSEIYKLNVKDLQQLCSAEGLGIEGTVRLLRPRLVRHLTGANMEIKPHTDTAQASAQCDASLDPIHSGPFESNFGSHMGGCSNVVPVNVKLLRKIPSLSSDDSEVILRLVVKLHEIHSLGLVDDKVFVIRILPLLSGAVLSFLENVCEMGEPGSSVNATCCVRFSPFRR